MRNCLRNKRFLNIFLLICLVGFLVLPQDVLADVQLPKGDTHLLLNSVQQVLIDKWFDLTTSPSFSEPEKQAALFLIRNAIQQKELEYAFVELPKEYLEKIVKIAVSLAISPDAGTILDKIEEESVKKAISVATEWLVQNEIKVASGVLTYSFTSYKGNPQNPGFYYNLTYHPLTEKEGELVVEFYSPEEIEPQGPTINVLGLKRSSWAFDDWRAAGNEKLEPFIVRAKGKVTKTEAGGYIWSDTSVEVTFSEPVPEIPIEKPLSFWERVKKFAIDFFTEQIQNVLHFNPFEGPAAVVETQLPEGEELEEEELEAEEPPAEVGQEVGQEVEEVSLKPEPRLTPEEIKGKLADIRKRIEILSQKAAELSQASLQKAASEKLTEEEEVKEEETKEETLLSLPKILISEICAGLDKAENEFVELYNPNETSVSLSNENFNLKLVNSSNDITKKKINWNRNIIPAKGYFLLVGGELKIDGQILAADATFSSQLTGTSGVIINDGQDTVLDKVAWGKPDKLPPPEAVETQGVILEQGLQTGESLERIKQGDNLIDNNNNSQDFILSSSPSPTNSSGEKKVYSPSTSSPSDDSSPSDEAPALDIQPPIADAGPDKTALTNETITFDASNSSDNIGIVSFQWDIDTDGQWDLAGVNPTLEGGYSQPGPYLVTLKVCDAAGNCATNTLTVTANAPPAPPQEIYRPAIGHNDPEEKWADETLAYNGDTNTGARATETWSDTFWWLELFAPTEKSHGIRLFIHRGAGNSTPQGGIIELYYNQEWHVLVRIPTSWDIWQEISYPEENVEKARFRFLEWGVGAKSSMFLNEFQFKIYE